MSDPGTVAPEATVEPMPPGVRKAAAGGGVVAVLLFLAMLMGGSWGLGQPNYTSNFLDLQGRAMLHGHLEVDARELGIEAICVDPPNDRAECPGNRAHVYFGPVPSLMRLPVLALTDRFDGRLTRVSMLLAVLALIVATARLVWAGRSLTRRGHPRELDEAAVAVVGLPDLIVAAAAPIAVVCGTVVWFLGSQTVVYHEAILWGVAFSALAYDAVIRLASAPTVGRVVLATTWSAAALLTRASVGIGPPLALGMLAAWMFLTTWRRRRAETPPAMWLLAGGGAAAVLVLYMAVNVAKFGTLFSLPLDHQLYSVINPQRRAALADNGGSLFGLRFVPSTLWQYLRPGAVRATGWFPYADYGPKAEPIGGAVFDTIGRSSSLPTSSVWLVALAPFACVALLRQRGPLLAALRFPLIGSAVGVLTALSIAFIANRYLGDLLPPLLLLGAVGVWVVVDLLTSRNVGVLASVVAVLAIGAAMVTDGALGLLEQRLYSPRTAAVLSSFVARQDELPAFGDPPVVTRRGFPAKATTSARPSTRLVVRDSGRCEALYVSDGSSWTLAELASPRHRRIALASADLSDRPVVLAEGVTARRVDGELVIRAGGFDSAPSPIGRDGVVVDLLADPTRPTLSVLVDDQPRMAVDIDIDINLDIDLAPNAAAVGAGRSLPVATPTLDAQRGCAPG